VFFAASSGAISPFFVFLGVILATLETKLVEMLTAPVEALGFKLWGIEFVHAGRHSILRVFIDSDKGVFIEDCAQASRQVSAVLDVEDPITTEYTLEVSSPGVDRPLFTAQQYQAYIGQDAKVQLTMPVAGSRNLKGAISKVEGQMLTLTVDGKDLIVALDNIRKGNVIGKF
jgi:ribosome maturation factor RimP